MSYTPNARFPRIASEFSLAKVDTVNTVIDMSALMFSGHLALAFPSDANYTLVSDAETNFEALKPTIKLTGTITAPRTVLIPTDAASGFLRQFTIWNATTGGFKVTIKTTAGGSTGVDINSGYCRAVWHDGTNVYAFGPEVSPTTGLGAPSALPAAIWARAYHNTTQSIPNATFTAIALNSERYDTDAIHDNGTNNSRLTCKNAGVYLIQGHAVFDFHATGFRQTAIRLNDTTYLAASTQLALPGAGDTLHLPTSTIYSLAVNDYVEFMAYQTSGAALNLLTAAQYTPEFMMVRLGS